MLIQSIQDVVDETAQTLGYEVLEISYGGSKSSKILKVIIYKKEGEVGTKDCSYVSGILLKKLEIEEVIPENFQLIVETPGVERIFASDKEYVLFQGKEVKIILDNFQKYNLKNNELIGILENFENDTIFIICKDKSYKINKQDIAKARLYFNVKNFL